LANFYSGKFSSQDWRISASAWSQSSKADRFFS
jgi:hypothetical protein